MSEPTVWPIWTPEDARQTARDAAKHVGIRGEATAPPEDEQARRLEVLDRLLAEIDCPLGMRPRRALRVSRLVIAGAVVVLVLALGALWSSSQAKADPPGAKCVDQFWWIPFQSNRRTICDTPIQPDGSWTRLREFYTPAHNVPLRTSCYGTYSISCTTTGGYFQPRTSNGIESYRVDPSNVLADEPGHIA